MAFLLHLATDDQRKVVILTHEINVNLNAVRSVAPGPVCNEAQFECFSSLTGLYTQLCVISPNSADLLLI